jgi:hypothetical protein
MLPWCTGMGAGGWLFMVLLWGSFIALAVWAITRLIPSIPPKDDHGQPLGAAPADGEASGERSRALR